MEQIADIFELVLKEYLYSPITTISKTSSQGYVVTEEYVIFGCNMPDGPSLIYLFHEMGHFVSTPKYEKLLVFSYGLTYNQIEVMGQLYDQPNKWSGIKNEIKAIIYQVLLSDKFGIESEVYSWLKSLSYLPDFCNVHPHNTYRNEDFKCLDFDTNEKLSMAQVDKRRLITMSNFYEEERIKPQYTLEYFDREWKSRVKYLDDNLCIEEIYKQIL
jgi:hypothetical protein